MDLEKTLRDASSALDVLENTDSEKRTAWEKDEIEVAKRRVQGWYVTLQKVDEETRQDKRDVMASISRVLDKINVVIKDIESKYDWCTCEYFDDVVCDPKECRLIETFVENNTDLGDPTRFERTKWSQPPREVIPETELSKIRWSAWRKHLIAACVNKVYIPPRTLTMKGDKTKTPFKEEDRPPPVSSTGIRTFKKIMGHIYLDKNNGALYFRCSNKPLRRILALEQDKRAVFAKYWNDPSVCSHRGRNTVHEKFLSNFVGITRAEVELFIRETEAYQVSSKHKVTPKVVNPLVTSRPMEHLQMDLVDMTSFGNYPGNGKYTFILVMVDCFSKFLWAKPLRNKEAPTVIEALTEIFLNDGFPTILQSDGGKEFTAKESQEWYKANGIQHRVGRAYKPSTQGQVERTNRTLKQAIYMDNLTSEDFVWAPKLPGKVFAYNTLVQSAINKSPFEIHRGWRPSFAPESYSAAQGEALRRVSPYVGDVAISAFLNDNRELVKEVKVLTNMDVDADTKEALLSDERLFVRLAQKNIPDIVNESLSNTFIYAASDSDRTTNVPITVPNVAAIRETTKRARELTLKKGSLSNIPDTDKTPEPRRSARLSLQKGALSNKVSA